MQYFCKVNDKPRVQGTIMFITKVAELGGAVANNLHII